MRKLRNNRLYIPAVTILGTVVVLLIVTAVSTFENLERQRAQNLASLEEQALTIINVLEAGARAGVRMPMWDEDSIGVLVEETGRENRVAYIYLCDGNGRIVHHSIRSIEGTVSNWIPSLSDAQPVAKRIRKQKDGSSVLDVAKPFMTLPPISIADPSRWDTIHTHHGDVIVLGMRMDDYEAARRSDLWHALIMGGIVVALGSGALFFLLVIQNVYTLDRSLRRTQDLNRQIISSMAEGLIGIDPSGRMIVANPLARDLLRIGSESVPGADLGSLIDLDDSGIRETLEAGKPVIHREISWTPPTGDSIPLSVSATPITGRNGKRQGVVVLIQDLRDIKRLEAEVRRSEKLAAVGRLAASVAHEIRNPLSSIRGFAGYLAARLNDWPKEKQYAEIMVDEVDRINRVITDLLFLSRPRLPEMAPVSVSALLRHVAALVHRDAAERGVAVQCDATETPGEIVVDRNQMTQVLLNLVINALNAVTDGTGAVDLGSAEAPDGNSVDIWVEDNGCGIPASERQRIFEPFFTSRDNGTGLGLTIVRNLVEGHGGSIRWHSPPPGRSKGTRFVIRLPRGDKE